MACPCKALKFRSNSYCILFNAPDVSLVGIGTVSWAEDDSSNEGEIAASAVVEVAQDIDSISHTVGAAVTTTTATTTAASAATAIVVVVVVVVVVHNYACVFVVIYRGGVISEEEEGEELALHAGQALHQPYCIISRRVTKYFKSEPLTMKHGEDIMEITLTIGDKDIRKLFAEEYVTVLEQVKRLGDEIAAGLERVKRARM
ncbi:hypothetical protein BC939DRAFT_501488 [Gamsiella multidivaricata]|uniref:uncharacterized protein n=1 Tax=Gamsiella multidivaricata TaxID=101098 RepID=UPI00221E8538|nr:uncharacterized protein BC939DRAFT_501488 [Gamsiella multidivaricata]KAI7827156.1 hypothetical protein BC939DRAFT_501488 [Gamsiella multidivaricata]